VWDQNGTKFAAKVIAKKALKSPKARQKLFSEIRIHQMLKHPNVVRFHHVFEDADNVYMILELCENKTFVDMIKKRKRLTEPEARYYMMQLLEAVQFMHDNKVIHRDLKLGNFFFAQDMQLKIGDFGLAALLMDESERKKTICGTPNYIAPEILFDKGGHSFAVDVWSIGVILYTMLIGRPPFQTKDVKEIYKRIRDNAYEFPEGVEVSPQAINLISSILVGDPSKRPSLKQIMEHNWFKSYIPQSIPVTAFMVPPPTPPSPSFPKPAVTVVDVKSSPIAPVLVEKSPVKALVEKLQGAFKKSQTPPKKIPAPLPPASPKRKSMLEALYFNLDQAITCSKQRNLVSIEAAMKDIVVDVPKIFVSKWIDYSNKYGLGYQLTNGSVGVYFNDATSIVMAADCEHFEYLDYASDNKSVMNRHAYTMSVYPDKIQKKVKLLKYFNQFMVENLSKVCFFDLSERSLFSRLLHIHLLITIPPT
jgi:serine/threonine protein kinase